MLWVGFSCNFPWQSLQIATWMDDSYTGGWKAFGKILLSNQMTACVSCHRQWQNLRDSLSLCSTSACGSHLTSVTVNREDEFKDKFLHVYNIFVNMSWKCTYVSLVEGEFHQQAFSLDMTKWPTKYYTVIAFRYTEITLYIYHYFSLTIRCTWKPHNAVCEQCDCVPF